MRVTGSRGFDQDVAVATQAFFGQAVMHGAHSQRGVNRQLARCDMTVTQNDLVVVAGETRLRQVLGNLLANALDALTEKGPPRRL